MAAAGECKTCLLQLGRYAGGAGQIGLEPTQDHIDSDRPGSARAGERVAGGPAVGRISAAEMAERFPQYEVLNLIGSGGMGAVYRARQKSLDRMVAIKVIEENDRDPAFAERFSREARTLAKLSHPHIVTVHDFGHSDNLFFLVMEYIEGVNLRQAIHAQAFDPSDALRIIEQVCQALQYAHGRGVVHRDIKPENILLTEDGMVKIADFGLAKLLDDDKREVTLTGTRQVMGTIAYMAPEQVDNSAAVDHRADIYSLGVVFYELLTGHLPLGRFELPSQRSAAVDLRIDPVVMKSLSRAPADRYQSASELSSEIAGIPAAAVAGVSNEDHPSAQRTSDLQMGKQGQPAPVAALPSRKGVGESGTLRGDSISFSLKQMHGGFAEGQGMLQFETDRLIFEWKVKDSLFGAIESNLNRLELPVDQVSGMQLKNYGIFTRLLVKARTLQALEPLPQEKLGSVKLAVSRADRELIQHWISSYNLHPQVGLVPPGSHSGNTGKALDWKIAVLLLALFFIPVLAAGALVLYFVAIPQPYSTDGRNRPAVIIDHQRAVDSIQVDKDGVEIQSGNKAISVTQDE
ncbi:serine/threonine-protein kinase [Planctomycetaceae bacterium SH139]